VTSATSPALAEAFRANEGFLRGLLYRLTGSAADADDLVQETFVRAIERPPPRQDAPWRPWLARVAVNLGRDHLRLRRRRRYVGPWLPSPIEADASGVPEFDPPAREQGDADPETRYDRLESISYAFLLALEALTPQQRAVLVLRDVLDYSVRETAEALEISEANVKTTHHRARRAMEAYDRGRRPVSALAEPTRRALERLVASLAAEDPAGLEAVLAEGVRVVSDGGGEFTAARVPVVGREKVVRFLLGLRRTRPDARVIPRSVNGLPALWIEVDDPAAGQAPRIVWRAELDAEGRIGEIHAVLASRKLSALKARG